MNNLDQLRERFEAEFKRRQPQYQVKHIDFYLRRNSLHLDMYAEYTVQSLWTFYQAAHISAVKQCAEIAENKRRLVNSEFFDIYGEFTVINAILALLPINESEVK